MRRMRNPNELFVGDLSFFCQEQHLFDLFSPYGTVVETRIKRSDKGGRTLMYGFVRMETLKAALEAAKGLNGFMMMGREIRVQLSLTNTYYDSSVKAKAGYQIQANFSSHFSPEELIQPTEELLRSVLNQFGEICDIVVKDYIQHKDENKQEGYALVTYSNEESAKKATEEGKNLEIGGINIECSPSLRNPKQAVTTAIPQPSSRNSVSGSASLTEALSSVNLNALVDSNDSTSSLDSYGLSTISGHSPTASPPPSVASLSANGMNNSSFLFQNDSQHPFALVGNGQNRQYQHNEFGNQGKLVGGSVRSPLSVQQQTYVSNNHSSGYQQGLFKNQPSSQKNMASLQSGYNYHHVNQQRHSGFQPELTRSDMNIPSNVQFNVQQQRNLSASDRLPAQEQAYLLQQMSNKTTSFSTQDNRAQQFNLSMNNVMDQGSFSHNMGPRSMNTNYSNSNLHSRKDFNVQQIDNSQFMHGGNVNVRRNLINKSNYSNSHGSIRGNYSHYQSAGAPVGKLNNSNQNFMQAHSSSKYGNSSGNGEGRHDGFALSEQMIARGYSNGSSFDSGLPLNENNGGFRMRNSPFLSNERDFSGFELQSDQYTNRGNADWSKSSCGLTDNNISTTSSKHSPISNTSMYHRAESQTVFNVDSFLSNANNGNGNNKLFDFSVPSNLNTQLSSLWFADT